MRLFLTLLISTLPLAAQQAKPIFDGKTLKGWNVHKGDEKYWSVKDGMIVGGSLTEKVTRNTFLSSQKSYQNYELTFKVRMVNGSGFVNSGMQVRSQRRGASMVGYQVDIGKGYWGMLYDEHRRNKMIGHPVDKAAIAKAAKDWEWNDYKIICNGPRIQSWINGVAALDYTEKDKNIPLDGVIGLQAHGGGKLLVQMKDVMIKELPAISGVKTWNDPRDKSSKAKEKAAQLNNKSSALSPADELKGFHLPEGFTAELVASEAQGVGKPITVQWDTAGRMWTMTAFEYPIDANENKAHAVAKYAQGGRDKVLVFDNPYGPGPHTPRTFADGLVIPLGMLPTTNGALVQYGTQIRHYYDKNKDGKAEGYDVVLDGFGIQDSHLFPHQFERAPGGWFYLAQGLFNYSNVVRPGGKAFANGSKSIPFRQCKLARFRPDGSEFEELTSGPNNIWGFMQKNNGETFLQEANDKGFPVVEYQQGVYYNTSPAKKSHPAAPAIPSSLNGFQMGGTGLSGIALTEEKQSTFNQLHRPAENVFYIANPITNSIQIVTTVRDENGHHSYKKQEDFLTSDDKWFRPVAIHFGPDGCLYIVDWYNKIISHNEVPRTHPDRDKTRGRIWRIRPNHLKITAPPNLAKANAEGLIAGLKHPNERVARLAWHAIANRKFESIPNLQEKLLKLVHSADTTINTRVLAFWSLEDLGVWKEHTSDLEKLAEDRSPYIRFEVIRSLSNLHLEEKTFLAIASHFPNDKNYRVRAELANTIRSHRSPTPAIVSLAAQLGKPPLSGNSRLAYHRAFERYLARWAMEKHQPVTAKMFNSNAASSLSPEAFLLAIQSLDPANASIQLINAIPRLKRNLSTDELSLLGSQINNPKVKEGVKSLLADPQRQLSILKAMEKMGAKVAADQELSNIVGNACLSLLSNQPSRDNQALVIRLAAKFRLKELEAPIKKWLLADGRSPLEIISGLTALREMGSSDRKVYQKFYASDSADIKRAAISALASIRDTSVVQLIAREWDKLPSDLRQLAVDGLTSSKDKAEVFARAIASEKYFKGITPESLGSLVSLLGAEHPSIKKILKNTEGLLKPVIRLAGTSADQCENTVDLKGPFTLEAWVKIDPKIGAEDTLLGKGKGGPDINFHDAKLRVFVNRKHGDVIVATRAAQPNTWMHVAITRNNQGKFKLYLDGELDVNKSKPFKGDMSGLKIGNSNRSEGTAMQLRELRVWNRERNKDEILVDFRTEYQSSKPPGLITRISGDTAGLKFSGKAKVKLTADFPKLIAPAAAKAAHEKFQKYLKLANAKGDPINGKAMFSTCSACHKVGDIGGIIGPDLSGAGAMSTEALLHNILTPNAKMESGYYRHDIILKNGNKVSGSLVEENKETLSILPVGSAVKVIKKSDIARHIIDKTSLMPPGLIDNMTPKQIADLFSYLRTLK